jgi:hypothetical protein
MKSELLEAQVALDQGDYRTVRRKLNRLTNPGFAVPEDLRSDVERLEKSVKSDPVALALAAGCLVFFAIVVWQYVL